MPNLVNKPRTVVASLFSFFILLRFISRYVDPSTERSILSRGLLAVSLTNKNNNNDKFLTNEDSNSDKKKMELKVGSEAWKTRTPRPQPFQEGLSVSFVHDGVFQVWTAGGFPLSLDSVYIYYPSPDTWKKGPKLPALLHHYFKGGFYNDGKLHIVGGLKYPSKAQEIKESIRMGWEDGISIPYNYILSLDLKLLTTENDDVTKLAWEKTRADVGGVSHCIERPLREWMYCYSSSNYDLSPIEYLNFYRINVNNVSEVVPLPSPGFIWTHASMFSDQERSEVLLTMGRPEDYDPDNSLWAFNIQKNQWRRVKDELSGISYQARATVIFSSHPEFVYLLGGQNASQSTVDSAVMRLDLRDYSFVHVSDMPSQLFAAGVGVDANSNKAYVIGGGTEAGHWPSDKVWEWRVEEEDFEGFVQDMQQPIRLLSAYYGSWSVREWVQSKLDRNETLIVPKELLSSGVLPVGESSSEYALSLTYQKGRRVRSAGCDAMNACVAY